MSLTRRAFITGLAALGMLPVDLPRSIWCAPIG